MRWHHVVQALAVEGNEGIHINQAPDPLRHDVGGLADHHAAVAVAHQPDVGEVTLLQEIDKGPGRIRQTDDCAIIVRPVSRERGAMHDMPFLAYVTATGSISSPACHAP